MEQLDLGGMICRDVDPTLVMQRIVEQLGQVVDNCDGAAILTPSGGWLRTVSATGVSAAYVGEAIPACSSLSGLALARGELLHSDDIRVDERVEPLKRAAEGRSMLSVPLRRGAEVIGVLVLISRQVAAFDRKARAAVMRVAEFVGVALASVIDTAAAAHDLLATVTHPIRTPDDGPGPTRADGEQLGEFLANVLRPGSVQRLRARQRVGSVLRDGRVQAVAQPIVDIENGRLIGVEALARVAEFPYRPPDVWISEAHAAGIELGLAFESLTVRHALELLDGLPDGVMLGINVSHELLVSGRVHDLLEQWPGERIMLELTEHTAFDDYAGFRDAMAVLGERGVRLAVDDVGAGFSSFRHVIELAPDCIKLDRLFTTGIDHDPARRAMAEALISFARATGIGLVAEGIETERQLEVARELGIRLGQGFLIAPPSRSGAIAPGFEQLVSRPTWPGRARGQVFARYGRRMNREQRSADLARVR